MGCGLDTDFWVCSYQQQAYRSRGRGRRGRRRRRKGCHRHASSVFTPPPLQPHGPSTPPQPPERTPRSDLLPPRRTARSAARHPARPVCHHHTTTPSHGPHVRRRPFLDSGPRSAPRGQLRHATRACPLQSMRATVTPHSTRLGCPRSWPSSARSKGSRTKKPFGASQGQVIPITTSIPHPTRSYAARIHAEIRCRVTLLTMSDSPCGDVRLSRARSFRGQRPEECSSTHHLAPGRLVSIRKAGASGI